MARLVALIPARAGSKSIKNKNIKLMGGLPLINWVIKAAVDASLIDQVYVSTDGIKIKNIVEHIDHPKLKVIGRSKQTATDTATSESVMLEFAEQNDFDHIILIQPTSPLLTSKDLDRGIHHYFDKNADSLVSLVRQKRFLWSLVDQKITPMNYDVKGRPRRQDFDGFLVENGAFYISSKKGLLDSKCRISGKIEYYEMHESSYTEIDEPEDWNIVESILFARRKEFERINKIKLFVSDVDGVLTDGGMYYSENGEELKKFNTRDGVGFQMIKDLGIKTAIITSEDTNIVKNRARKLGIDYLFQGVSKKLNVLQDLCNNLGVKLSEVAFIGDDNNDTQALKSVGFSACPRNAIDQNKYLVDYVCNADGGEGCVREIAELIVNL